MRVLISGSSGLIGTALRAGLAARGDEVVRLVRRPPAEQDEIEWDPAPGVASSVDLSGFDAVVNLNGVSIGEKRWTAGRKAAIRSSRVDVTKALVTLLSDAKDKPRVLVSASAIGVYGDRGADELTEASPPGPEGDFLAGVVTAWEAATRPAEDAGIRVVLIRSGVVFSGEGGVLPRMALPFRIGAGGRIGDGKQWMSWVDIEDAVSAILHVIGDDGISGPVNVTAPNPVSNAEITAVLGRVLRRPTFLPVPRFALNLRFGTDLVDALLYSSARVLPVALERSGFTFRYPDVESSLRHALLSRRGESNP